MALLLFSGFIYFILIFLILVYHICFIGCLRTTVDHLKDGDGDQICEMKSEAHSLLSKFVGILLLPTFT